MAESYEAPRVRFLGSVEDLTAQSDDKIGSVDDLITLIVPTLDGEVLPDP